MARRAAPKAGRSKAGKTKGTRPAPRRKTPAARASHARGGTSGASAKAKYEQPGAPWWKPFLPR